MAHALEHILFKGNEKLKEDEINEKLDDLFGFNNAMTNFLMLFIMELLQRKILKKDFLYMQI